MRTARQEKIKSGAVKNMLVMVGAGISVSAGIPDFRTPGTGLYDNLAKYDLPSPQHVFEINYFRQSPKAFYALAAELHPAIARFNPTPTHHFLKVGECILLSFQVCSRWKRSSRP
jgi:NAD-dependent deacetylase sirtuin 2